MDKICQNPKCGNHFEAKRNNALYCSTKCRVEASRNNDEPVIVHKATILLLPSNDELKNVIEYCTCNNMTPDELIAFHRKYYDKIQKLGLDQKKILSATNMPNLSYLEERRLAKNK